MKYLKYLMLIAVVGTLGCGDKETTDPDENKDLTPYETLGTHDWVLTDRHRDGTSIWDNYEACYQDNIYTFAADSSYLLKEGPTKCSFSVELDTYYILSLAHDSIFIDDFPYMNNQNYKIVSLSEDLLELEFTNGGGVWYYKYEEKP